MVTDAQVRKLMDEMSKHSRIGVAALRSGMHRNTARKYVEAGKSPLQLRPPRTWRTREDPFAEDWDEIVERLKEAPELEAPVIGHCGVFKSAQVLLDESFIEPSGAVVRFEVQGHLKRINRLLGALEILQTLSPLVPGTG